MPVKNPRLRLCACHPVARIRGERLFLAPDLRRELVAELLRDVARGSGGEDPESEAGSGFGKSRYGVEADRQAFACSVSLERFGEFYLRNGFGTAAFRTFRAAALAALSGEEYDHGEESLPARFLRIRFYDLLERLRACLAADPRLRKFGADPLLAAEARRLGGEYL